MGAINPTRFPVPIPGGYVGWEHEYAETGVCPGELAAHLASVFGGTRPLIPSASCMSRKKPTPDVHGRGQSRHAVEDDAPRRSLRNTSAHDFQKAPKVCPEEVALVGKAPPV